MPSVTVENYLKALYLLSDSRQPEMAVALGDLARSLDLAPGTVTSMIKRLSRDTEFVQYRPHKGANLTDEGRIFALKILRRHRIMELFLVNTLGLNGEDVHDEAENLEHAASDRLIEKIADHLGNPHYDPHGAPIPTATGEMPEEIRLLLADAAPGEFEVLGHTEVDDAQAFVQFLEERGLLPGVRIDVMNRDSQADVITLQKSPDGGAGEELVHLGMNAASRILLRQCETT